MKYGIQQKIKAVKIFIKVINSEPEKELIQAT